jgi:RNA polymerase sigma-70 factor (ECF subfamily)
MTIPGDETATGGAGGTFRSTLWTLVLRAKDPDAPDRRKALEELIQTYWKPAYFFLRRRGHDREESKDIVQGYFAALLERDLLQYLDRDRGKFRTFLLTTLQHYASDERDRQRAQKRGGGRAVFSLDFVDAESDIAREPASEDTPETIFRRDWARRVMARALEIVRADFVGDGKSLDFEALRLHLSGQAPSYADVARQLGITEADARQRAHRTRARYREAILEVVRSYTESEADAQDEVKDLFSALA